MDRSTGDGSTTDPPTVTESSERTEGATPDDPAPGAASVEVRLEDTLERVAHGAVVTVPSKLLDQGLTLVFTAILTNGFAASSYGIFVLAQRLQEYLSSLAMGLGSGLSRFLPTASPPERDVLATFASLLLVGVATLLGSVGYVAAPLVAQVADKGPQFQLFVRIFAAGLPALTWLFTGIELLRGLEEVGPLNLAFRIGVPSVTLVVAGLGTYVLHDLVVVAIGVVLVPGLVGVVVVAWLARERGLRPRLGSSGAGALRRRYARFTAPLFVGRFATATQVYGFYPLIAVFLSGVAGGVFVVGTLVGSLVQLPLGGVNQFIAPVFATLHEQRQRETLRRLYQVTSRLVLVLVAGLAVPLVVYRDAVMSLFGPTFVQYAPLLPGFVAGHVVASAVGSVALLLKMTDHHRAFLGINVVTTAVLVVAAIPLTMTYGLPGLTASYFLLLTVNNGLELAVLYHLEGLQPFTWSHLKPLVAAVPMFVATVATRAVLPAEAAPLVGTLVGAALYVGVLRALGFDRAERRLVNSLVGRYSESVSGFGRGRVPISFEREYDIVLVAIGVVAVTVGLRQALRTGPLVSTHSSGLSIGVLGVFTVLGGLLVLVVGLVGAMPESHRLRRTLWALLLVATLLVVLVGVVLEVV